MKAYKIYETEPQIRKLSLKALLKEDYKTSATDRPNTKQIEISHAKRVKSLA